jgi:hypothetical protein
MSSDSPRTALNIMNWLSNHSGHLPVVVAWDDGHFIRCAVDNDVLDIEAEAAFLNEPTADRAETDAIDGGTIVVPSEPAEGLRADAVEAVASWLHKNAATRRQITCGPDSTGCRLSHRLDAEEILALASHPTPSTAVAKGLDVERLARAKAIVDENDDEAWEKDPPMHDTWRDEARMMLAEYARLTTSEPETEQRGEER